MPETRGSSRRRAGDGKRVEDGAAAFWLALFFYGCLACSACSAPSLPVGYERAQDLEHEGKLAEALMLYTTVWKKGPKKKHRALGGMRRAGLLARMKRYPEAIETYLGVELGPGSQRRIGARALFRAGRLLYEKTGRKERALRIWQKALMRYPATAAADDSLDRIVLHYRATSPKDKLLVYLWSVFRALRDRPVSDNVLWSIAEIYRRETNDLHNAARVYDRIAVRDPKGPLADDASFRAASIYRKLGKPLEALVRYDRILRTKSDSWVVGSFNSLFLDDAQLQVGLTWLEDLGKPGRAVDAFRRLADDFESSVLRDDALWWLALTHLRRGDENKALAAHQELARRFPSSRFVRQRQALVDWAPVARRLGRDGDGNGNDRKDRWSTPTELCEALSRHAKKHPFGWFRDRRRELSGRAGCKERGGGDGGG
jgi:tetratricopeptide (TPR) repeat protein